MSKRMSRKTRALTLVEILVVLAIVAIITALVAPVYRSAKFNAKILDSQNRLKQIHLAFMLYREDNGGENGYYGEPSEMNLPHDHHIPFVNRMYGMSMPYRDSPCGRHPHPDALGRIFIHMMDGGSFAKDARLYKENLRIAMDMNCNDSDYDALADERTKRGLGILLSGQSVRVMKRGWPFRPSFWADPMP